MKVTVLGSGSAIQFENRASASFLVEHNGRKILLDAGFSLMDRLEKINVMADEIDAVYISHEHPDHCFGLFHMLFALNNKYYSPKRELTIFGFEKISEWFDKYKNILGHWIQPDTELRFDDNVSGEIFGIRWETFKTKHKDNSTGITFQADEHKLVYSGDSEYFEGFEKIIDGADLFIAECGSGNEQKNRGHMSIKDIQHMTSLSSVKRVLLTHIYPETDPTPVRWSDNGTAFMRSYDLQQIDLKNPEHS